MHYPNTHTHIQRINKQKKVGFFVCLSRHAPLTVHKTVPGKITTAGMSVYAFLVSLSVMAPVCFYPSGSEFQVHTSYCTVEKRTRT